jgi:hypothetical protein
VPERGFPPLLRIDHAWEHDRIHMCHNSRPKLASPDRWRASLSPAPDRGQAGEGAVCHLKVRPQKYPIMPRSGPAQARYSAKRGLESDWAFAPQGRPEGACIPAIGGPLVYLAGLQPRWMSWLVWCLRLAMRGLPYYSCPWSPGLHGPRGSTLYLPDTWANQGVLTVVGRRSIELVEATGLCILSLRAVPPGDETTLPSRHRPLRG